MDKARDRITGNITSIKNAIIGTSRYICPNPSCNAPVIIALGKGSRIPHFKHKKGYADKGCELYCSSIPHQIIIAIRPPIHKLILSEKNKKFHLSIYIPEFDKQSFIEIGENIFSCLYYQIENEKVSFVKTWPGTGGTIVSVPFKQDDYKVEVLNKETTNFNFTKYEGNTPGLSPQGTLFKHTLYGGQRIDKDFVVSSGEPIILVGIEENFRITKNLWPCSIKYDLVYIQDNWSIFEISFPNGLNLEIISWLSKFGYSIKLSDFKYKLLWPTPSKEYNDGTIEINQDKLFFEICPEEKLDELIIDYFELHKSNPQKSLFHIKGPLLKGKSYFVEVSGVLPDTIYCVSLGNKVKHEIRIISRRRYLNACETNNIIIEIWDNDEARLINPLFTNSIDIDPNTFKKIIIYGLTGYKAIFQYNSTLSTQKILPTEINYLDQLPESIEFFSFGRVSFKRLTILEKNNSIDIGKIKSSIDHIVRQASINKCSKYDEKSISLIKKLLLTSSRLSKLNLLTDEVNYKLSYLFKCRFSLPSKTISELDELYRMLNECLQASSSL